MQSESNHADTKKAAVETMVERRRSEMEKSSINARLKQQG